MLFVVRSANLIRIEAELLEKVLGRNQLRFDGLGTVDLPGLVLACSVRGARLGSRVLPGHHLPLRLQAICDPPSSCQSTSVFAPAPCRSMSTTAARPSSTPRFAAEPRLRRSNRAMPIEDLAGPRHSYGVLPCASSRRDLQLCYDKLLAPCDTPWRLTTDTLMIC